MRRVLSYPDDWFVEGFSPDAQDVRDAYVQGMVSDHALDNELEWALENPTPPAFVALDGDSAHIQPEPAGQLSSPTFGLVEDGSNTVNVDRVASEMEMNDGTVHRATIRFEIECHRDEIAMVLESMVAGLDDD